MAVVNGSSKLVGMLSQTVQTHQQIAVRCMLSTCHSSSWVNVCNLGCSGIALCLTSWGNCNGKWSATAVAEVQEVESRLQVDAEGSNCNLQVDIDCDMVSMHEIPCF